MADYKSQLWVVDAGNVTAGPVAKVHVPVPLRPQVHGWWVPSGQLANSKVAPRQDDNLR